MAMGRFALRRQQSALWATGTIGAIVLPEIDDQTVPTVLRLDEYDGSDESSWVLLHEETTTA